MNISGLGIGSASSVIKNMQQANIRVRSAITPENAANSKATESTTVSISDEGQKKLSSELGTTMYKNSQHIVGSKTKESKQADTRSDVQKKIDKLKEEIKELNNQRQKFASDRSEGAKEQRKIIDGKIMMLNSQIATLLKVQKDQAASA